MNRVEEEKRFWDKTASKYDKNALSLQSLYDDTIGKIKSLLHDDDAVLETACGTGIITVEMAPYCKKITGTDVSKKMLEIAGEKAREKGLGNVAFQYGDICALPFEDEIFDVVLVPNVLYLIKEPADAVKECARGLKKRGRMITATDCYGEKGSLLQFVKKIVVFSMKITGMLPYASSLSSAEIDSMAEDAGLKKVSGENLGKDPVNYFSVYVKD